MPILTRDYKSGDEWQGSQTTFNTSFVLDTAYDAGANDRMAVISVLSYENTGGIDDTEITGIDFDTAGVNFAMTKAAGSAANDPHASYWYILDADLPTAAGTYTCAITVSTSATSARHKLSRVEYTNVDQVTPIAETYTRNAAYVFGGSFQHTFTAGHAVEVVFSSNNAGGSVLYGSEDFNYSSGNSPKGKVLYSLDSLQVGVTTQIWIWAAAGVAINSTATPPDITDVDTDEIITVGQTSVAVTGTLLDAAPNTVHLTDGVNTVEQTTWSASSGTAATFDVDRGTGVGALATAASLRTYTLQAETVEGVDKTPISVTFTVESGWSDIRCVDPITSSESVLSLVVGATPATGDVIEYETNNGAVSIAANGVVTCTFLPQTFSWRFYDLDANELSNTGTMTVAAITLPTDSTLTANRLRNSGSYSSAIPAVSTLPNVLAVGNYETPESWEALTVIAPRPYTEYTGLDDGGGLPTSSDTHKHVYTHWVTDTTWRVPIGAINGAFPYIYRLIGAPTGMVLKQTISINDWSDYGYIEWPTADIVTAGEDTYEWTLQVIDQTGAQVLVRMALNVADANAVRIDASAGATGDGSSWVDGSSGPYDAIADVYGQAGFNDKLVLLRGTLANTVGSNLTLTDGNEPNCWIGDPDESTRPKVTLSSGNGHFANGNALAFLHFEVNGTDPALGNPRQIIGTAGSDRSVVANMRFTDQDCGGTLANAQNNGVLFQGADGTSVQYVLVKDCYVDNFRSDGPVSARPSPTDNNGGPYKFMYLDQSLAEDLTMGSQDTSNGGGIQHFFQLKHNTSDCTVRLLRTTDLTATQGALTLASSGSNIVDDNSHCVLEFNKIIDSAGEMTRWGSGETGGDLWTDLLIRRNTFVDTGTATMVIITSENASNTISNNNVTVSVSLPSAGTGWTHVETNTLADPTHTDGDLGSGHASYGKKGWEIA